MAQGVAQEADAAMSLGYHSFPLPERISSGTLHLLPPCVWLMFYAKGGRLQVSLGLPAVPPT